MAASSLLARATGGFDDRQLRHLASPPLGIAATWHRRLATAIGRWGQREAQSAARPCIPWIGVTRWRILAHRRVRRVCDLDVQTGRNRLFFSSRAPWKRRLPL